MSAGANARRSKNAVKGISLGMKSSVSVVIGKSAMTPNLLVYGKEICSGKMMIVSVSSRSSVRTQAGVLWDSGMNSCVHANHVAIDQLYRFVLMPNFGMMRLVFVSVVSIKDVIIQKFGIQSSVLA
jgi:hypothetical protein